MKHQNDNIRPVIWQSNQLHLLDQRKLPDKETMMVLEKAPDVTQAIKDMVVRGAPAIGITAAYGVVLAAKAAYAINPEQWKRWQQQRYQRLLQTRLY